MRALIALLFVYAGVGKIMGFDGAVGYIGSSWLPFPMLMAIVAIIVEIPVALLYVYGWKKDCMGWALIAFTALATIVFHNPWAGGIFSAMTATMALKNIAIIGGVLATLGCACGTCESCKAKNA